VKVNLKRVTILVFACLSAFTLFIFYNLIQVLIVLISLTNNLYPDQFALQEKRLANATVNLMRTAKMSELLNLQNTSLQKILSVSDEITFLAQLAPTLAGFDTERPYLICILNVDRSQTQAGLKVVLKDALIVNIFTESSHKNLCSAFISTRRDLFFTRNGNNLGEFKNLSGVFFMDQRFSLSLDSKKVFEHLGFLDSSAYVKFFSEIWKLSTFNREFLYKVLEGIEKEYFCLHLHTKREDALIDFSSMNCKNSALLET
jgi:hypothetical protein